MTMTNAEWCIKQGYKFRELTCKGSKTGNCDYNILLNNKCVGKVKNSYSNEAITTWLDMEHVEPILDDAEKRYLRAVIRPFRNDVYSIKKVECLQREMICINTKNRYMVFPPFDKGTMYRGMKVDWEYTLEELGL